MSRRTRRAKMSVDQVDLREQVNLLTAENEKLKAMLAGNVLAGLSTPAESTEAATPTAVAATPKGKGCSCRGNCSTRACGCVKKNQPCAESCKCSDERCHNQEPDKENIGEANTNIQVRNPGKPRSLFSPDTEGAAEQLKVLKLENTSLEFEDESHEETEEQIAQGSDTSNDLKPESSSPEKPEDVTFDPMKPRHALSRSPVVPRNETHPNQTLDVSEIPLPMPMREEPAVELPPPQELNEVVVDWDKHQAERVYCRQCKRGFYPYRIKKHEASCQNI